MSAPYGPGAPTGDADGRLRSIPFDASELGNLRLTATLMFVAGGLGVAKSLVDLATQGLSGALALSKSTDALFPVIANLCGGLLSAVVLLVLAVWLFIGGKAFRQVAETDDQDQVHLVHGLRQLRNVFLLKSVLIIATVLFVCCGFILGTSTIAAVGAAR